MAVTQAYIRLGLEWNWTGDELELLFAFYGFYTLLATFITTIRKSVTSHTAWI